MRKLTVMAIGIIFVLVLMSGAASAEGSIPSTASDATTFITPEGGTNIAIAPDNILYTVKRIIENIQVAITFTPEEKAELLVTLADKRLAEADLMMEKNKQELVEQVMKAYLETVEAANKKLEEAALGGQNVTAVLEDIRIVELTAEKLVIKATGIIPADSAEALKAQVTEQVQSTLAVQAFAIAKADFKDANAEVKTAKTQLKAAEKSGDEALIKAAKEKLALALQAKTDAETLKDQVEVYKEEMKKVSDDDDEEDEDKLDSEKLQEKLEKMQKVIKKQQEKREEQIKKHIEQNGKASEKIEANAKKQLEKKQSKVDALKAQQAAGQTVTTTEQAIIAAETTSATETKVTFDSADTDEEDEDDKDDKDDKDDEDDEDDNDKDNRKGKEDKSGKKD